ncbi:MULTISPECIES: hypothetical protein [Desertifilum]|nr:MULTISPECIES: hypothetical protein [Desertifilum]MDA0209077.1 hypothetical protein [Cyanobacteria bacterium FC1]
MSNLLLILARLCHPSCFGTIAILLLLVIKPACAEPAPSADAPMNQSSEQIDPLNSPYPVPWNWVMATYTEVSNTRGTGVRYYRSPSLISPDGRYAAYSRIQLQVKPELYNSRVNSIMFLENLATGDLRVITAASPLANNPLTATEASQMPGAIAILMPVAWSEVGDRILARQFEGLFSSSNASDYAVIWDRQGDRTHTLSPQANSYSHAVLLGWSQNNPNRVLFRAGHLGDENWPLLAVDATGKTLMANGDRPMTFGRVVNNIWAGPQAYR